MNERQRTIRDFRELWFKKDRLWRNMQWRGLDMAKTPCDAWMYHEIIWELKPSVIVEFGVSAGGCVLFYADLMTLGDWPGVVLGVDRKRHDTWPNHPRIKYHVGSSRSDEAVSWVREQVRLAPPGHVLLIEDSEHTRQHVAGELELYADLVTPGSYFIVEDGALPDGTPAGPGEAVEDFLQCHREFERDRSREKYLLTLAAGGFLRRKK